MRFKKGVRIKKVTPEIVVAMIVANQVYNEEGIDFTVTSVNDGKHMEGSKHYEGNAFDCRIRYLPKPQKTAYAIRNRLTEDYDVVLEETHIHIEYDPK